MTNDPNHTFIMLVAAEARRAAENATTLDERIELTMKAAMNHFMVQDEPTQFAGARVALWELSNAEERERIEEDAKSLATLSAMMSGVAVDLTEYKVPENLLGLLGRWKKIRETEGKR